MGRPETRLGAWAPLIECASVGCPGTGLGAWVPSIGYASVGCPGTGLGAWAPLIGCASVGRPGTGAGSLGPPRRVRLRGMPRDGAGSLCPPHRVRIRGTPRDGAGSLYLRGTPRDGAGSLYLRETPRDGAGSLYLRGTPRDGAGSLYLRETPRDGAGSLGKGGGRPAGALALAGTAIGHLQVLPGTYLGVEIAIGFQRIPPASTLAKVPSSPGNEAISGEQRRFGRKVCCLTFARVDASAEGGHPLRLPPIQKPATSSQQSEPAGEATTRNPLRLTE
jgi:hypothetical protein